MPWSTRWRKICPTASMDRPAPMTPIRPRKMFFLYRRPNGQSSLKGARVGLLGAFWRTRTTGDWLRGLDSRAMNVFEPKILAISRFGAYNPVSHYDDGDSEMKEG